jgi:hypothetical protein
MSRTLKDIRKIYLSEAEQLERSHYSLCGRCDWCLPEQNRVRKSDKKKAIEFELNLIELDEANELLLQAVNKFNHRLQKKGQ